MALTGIAPASSAALPASASAGGAVDGDAWAALAEADPGGNVFFHPAFVEPAATGLHARPTLVAVRGRDRLPRGAAPFVRTRLGRIAPALSAWAHEYGPLGLPLLADAAAANGFFREALAAAGPGRALVFPFLPVGPASDALAAAAAADGRKVLRSDQHERAFLRRSDGVAPREALTSRRRKEYGRLLRRLGDEVGPVVLEQASEPEAVAAAFEEFLRLEVAGWKGRRGTAMARLPNVAGFARSAIGRLAAAGLCRVLTLRAGDRVAASLVCLQAGGTAMTWKIAYDESLGRFSPGAQLMLDAPAILFADPRIDAIDSCAAPNHPMIDHLWRGRLALATVVVAPRRGRMLFRAGLAARSAEDRLRDLAKRALRRGRGNKPAHAGDGQ